MWMLAQNWINFYLWWCYQGNATPGGHTVNFFQMPSFQSKFIISYVQLPIIILNDLRTCVGGNITLGLWWSETKTKTNKYHLIILFKHRQILITVQITKIPNIPRDCWLQGTDRGRLPVEKKVDFGSLRR